MDFQQLRHILAAAETKSYSRAAERFNTSRQNIAHSVKLVERELGTTLFERKDGAMVLTVAGKQVIAHVNDVITRVDSLYAICSSEESEDDKLAVSLSTNLFAGMSPHTDVFFLEQSSSVRFLEQSTEGCFQSVLLGECDLAIVMCMERAFLGCSVHEMLASPVFALVSNSSHLVDCEFIEITDLRDQELVVMSSPEFQYVPLINEMKALGYRTDTISIITSTSSALRLVRSRGAMALVSDVFAHHPPMETVSIPFKDSRFDWHFYALYKADSPKYQAIMDFISGATEAFAANTDFVPAVKR